ncbi:Arginine/serine-rich coiled-coil 1 [Plakobranchus ocellatus]|uniref:Arginine/serine-rich coiled-coil 1 n=1 Tax=Plakobranchus ocellatus TaxID=259542 RepID=A0AAV4C504_9GAST|nr:Arginine/serine-rich coiled-coil 1 [Plakobranchus ocellatus]
MGRYRSDESDDDRESSRKYKKKSKKRRGRSRSGSDSGSSHLSSSRGKKSKKKHARSPRSLSRDRDQGRSSRRSRSPSYDRYYGTSSRRSRRSRSRSRSPSARKSKYSRSPYRSTSRSPSMRKSRRSRSTSRSRNQRRRSSPDSRGDASADMRSRMNLSEQEGNGAALTSLTPAQQAEERMRLALKAAAEADQKLRMLPSNNQDTKSSVAPVGLESSQPRFSSYEESQNFASSVAAIDSGNFSQAAFKSSRSTKPQETPTYDLGPSHDDAIFGSLAVTGFTIKPDPDTKPIDLDPESIMHPSLFTDPEERLDRWIERLTQLRRRKLEGDAL